MRRLDHKTLDRIPHPALLDASRPTHEAAARLEEKAIPVAMRRIPVHKRIHEGPTWPNAVPNVLRPTRENCPFQAGMLKNGTSVVVMEVKCYP